MPELYRNPPRVWARGTISQTIPANNVPQFIEFDDTPYDVGGWFDEGTDPTIVTVPNDGLYSVKFMVSMSVPGGSTEFLRALRAYVMKNFSLFVIGDVLTTTDPNTAIRAANTKDIELEAGDTLSLRVQNGASVDLQSVPSFSTEGTDGGAQFIQARWVAPLAA